MTNNNNEENMVILKFLKPFLTVDMITNPKHFSIFDVTDWGFYPDLAEFYDDLLFDIRHKSAACLNEYLLPELSSIIQDYIWARTRSYES